MENKILLVDDEEDILEVLAISLEDRGYAVKTAPSGEKALDVLEEESYPIVLCDIKMPGMDGIELLRTIKTKQPDTEVVMITGHGDMELAIKSLKFDATDFITKPINEDILDVALKRCRERYTMREQLRAYTEDLEKLVEEKSKKLVEAERMAAIGETVAGLSHAIKNIAGALKGGMFVLEKGLELDNKQYLNQGWEMVKGNVDKIKKLAIDLLNFGKSSKADFKPADPNVPAEEAVSLFQPEANSYNIALELETADDLKPVHMDSEGLYCCLTNLVSNAIDACKYDTKADVENKVVVKTARTEQNEVIFQVTDNGCGMDEQTLDKIFQNFFSTKGTRGTGIGLMMSQKIVELHGGVIEVESEKGVGSTFTIRIPENREKAIQ